jgi:hypothetical protein
VVTESTTLEKTSSENEPIILRNRNPQRQQGITPMLLRPLLTHRVVMLRVIVPVDRNPLRQQGTIDHG